MADEPLALARAVHRGLLFRARALLAAGADPAFPAYGGSVEPGDDPAFPAYGGSVEPGDEAGTGAGISREPDSQYAYDPIRAALRWDDPRFVADLARAGADPNGRPLDYPTPVEIAAAGGSPRALEALLEAGAGPNVHEADTLAESLVNARHTEALCLLLGHGMVLGPETASECVRLSILAPADIAATRSLIEAGAAVPPMDAGRLPRESRELYERARVWADRRVPRGRGFEIPQAEPCEPHDCVVWSDGPLLRRLAAGGADLNARSRAHDGATPVELAVRLGRVATLRVLLELGARPGKALLEVEMAIPNANSIVGVLLAAGADVAATDERGQTPLDLAVATPGAAPPLVRTLVMAGADPNAGPVVFGDPDLAEAVAAWVADREAGAGAKL